MSQSTPNDVWPPAQYEQPPWTTRPVVDATANDPNDLDKEKRIAWWVKWILRCAKWIRFLLILIHISVVSRGVAAGKKPWIADCPKIVTIIVLLAVFSSYPSPNFPDVSEWEACGKELRMTISILAATLAAHYLLTLLILLRLLFRLRDRDEISVAIRKQLCVPTGIHLAPRRADTLPDAY